MEQCQTEACMADVKKGVGRERKRRGDWGEKEKGTCYLSLVIKGLPLVREDIDGALSITVTSRV